MTDTPKWAKPPESIQSSLVPTREDAMAWLDRAEDLLSTGHPRHLAVKILQKEFKVTKFRARRLLDQVADRWLRIEQHPYATARRRIEAVRRLENDAHEARQVGDLKSALTAETLRSKIEGTLAPTKIEVAPVMPEAFNPDLYSPAGLAEVMRRPLEFEQILKEPGMAAIPLVTDGADKQEPLTIDVETEGQSGKQSD